MMGFRNLARGPCRVAPDPGRDKIATSLLRTCGKSGIRCDKEDILLYRSGIGFSRGVCPAVLARSPPGGRSVSSGEVVVDDPL